MFGRLPPEAWHDYQPKAKDLRSATGPREQEILRKKLRKVEMEREAKEKAKREETRRKENRTLNDSNEHMMLYKAQELLAHGEIFIKNSRFSRSRKYYAELRGCTIVAYRTANYAHDYARKEINGVAAALPVNNYRVEATSGEDSKPRIYLTPIKCSENPLIYIRVPDEEEALQAWTTALGRLQTYPMPVLNDLSIESVIGRGGGGKVFLVIWRRNTYALKVIDKTPTFKYARAFRHVASERLLMEKAGDHPFLLPMEYAFQTDANLYILTPFCAGGDLASYIRHHGMRSVPFDGGDYVGSNRKRLARLSEEQTRNIACEILLGLEHLHSRGIVYRDLKPENVFISKEGYLQIGDYGLSKFLNGNRDGEGRVRTHSVCGTRNYLPPEMLHGELYSFESDLWSLGVMMYRMLVGTFPFDAGRTREVFHRIKMEVPKLPKWLSADARQVVRGLLQKDVKQRVGIKQLKRMPFFKGVDWDKVVRRESEPPIKDIEVGKRTLDALENFELSKLYGITLGELVGPMGGQPDLEIPYHRKDPKTSLIGFEFSRRKEFEKETALEVRVTSGNFLRKLASIDVVSPLVSPRKRGIQ